MSELMKELDEAGAQILRHIPDDSIMQLVHHNNDDFSDVTAWINEYRGWRIKWEHVWCRGQLEEWRDRQP